MEDELSSYYLACEVQSRYEGMAVAVPAEEGDRFASLSVKDWAGVLHRLARKVDWSRYTKSTRGPKKPVKRQKAQRGTHVATAQLLEQRKNRKRRARVVT